MTDSDCWTCKHSIYAGRAQIDEWSKQGYQVGRGEIKRGAGLRCEKHLIVKPVPSYRCGWERSVWSDDE